MLLWYFVLLSFNYVICLYATLFFFVVIFVCLYSDYDYNTMSYKWKVQLAKKTGLIKCFLHWKMSVPSQNFYNFFHSSDLVEVELFILPFYNGLFLGSRCFGYFIIYTHNICAYPKSILFVSCCMSNLFLLIVFFFHRF